jgi:hypothetical protein
MRSASTIDSFRCPVLGRFSLHFQSVNGQLMVFTLPYEKEWKRGSYPRSRVGEVTQIYWPVLGNDKKNDQNLYFYQNGRRIAAMPDWAVLLSMTTSTIIASLSFIRDSTYRFSLRTLLTVTTLVAVGLGLIVWLR